MIINNYSLRSQNEGDKPSQAMTLTLPFFASLLRLVRPQISTIQVPIIYFGYLSRVREFSGVLK